MSDSTVNVLRRWNYGLRDEDLVAFIYCNREENSHWLPSNELNIFNIGEMRECEEADLTRLGEPKSASEGAERDRRWPGYVPTFSGVVSSIDDGKIKFLKDDGRKQTKTIQPGHTVYISPGDRVFENATIVHSILPTMQDHHCDNRFYDFLADLGSDNLETVYCAVKALGFLPELIDSSIPMLYEILNIEDLENRLRLEVICSLARLGENVWEYFQQQFSETIPPELQMETAMILGELVNDTEACDLLLNVARSSNHSELRCEAIWVLGTLPSFKENILDFIADDDVLVATHALAVLEKNMDSSLTELILNRIGNEERESVALSRLIAKSTNLNDERIVSELISTIASNKYKWILYAIGLGGKERFEGYINRLDSNADSTKEKLLLLWNNHRNWLSRDIVDTIEFLKLQN
jgi:hypothetical protein